MNRVISTSLLLLSITLIPLAGARPSDRIRFEEGEVTALEVEFFSDLNDGMLDVFSPYDAFIIASGIRTREAFSSYQEKLFRVRERALALLSPYRDETARVLGKRLLVWLHENVLDAYEAKATLASDILDRGAYNCLSSGILYAMLAEDLGMTVEGVMVPDHAFCQVITEEDGREVRIDVETTVKYGFDPGTKDIERLKNETRYIYVPKKNYRNRENVTLYQTIGMLYANRISLLEPRKNAMTDCVKNISRYKKGYYFNPTSSLFEENIVTCYRNLAIREGRAKRLDGMLHYIARGRAFAPNEPIFDELTVEYHQKRAIAFEEAGNYQGAIDAIHEGLAEYPGNAILVNNLSYFYNAWGLALLHTGAYDDAIDVFSKGLIEQPGDRALTGNIVKAYHDKAKTTYEGGAYREAIEILLAGRMRFPENRDLTALLAHVYNKWALSYFDADAYAVARRILLEGLELVPNDQYLAQNLLYSYANEANGEYKKNNFSRAVSIAKEGLARFPRNRQLVNVVRNVKVYYLNAAVKSYNAKMYSKTLAYCNEALLIDVAISDVDKELRRIKGLAQQRLR